MMAGMKSEAVCFMSQSIALDYGYNPLESKLTSHCDL